MGDYEHIFHLDAIKNSGPPMNAFMKVSQFINPEGYEINPMLLELLHAKKFAGDGTEDPYNHIDFFREVCETFKFNAFTYDEVKFKLFNQTLVDKAHIWLRVCPTDITDTWEKLSSAFLTRFYPESKSHGASRMITNFKNPPYESLYDGYKRFRGFLNNCPHHGFPPWLILHTFYGGLNIENRT